MLVLIANSTQSVICLSLRCSHVLASISSHTRANQLN